MSKTILANVTGWTPLIDCITKTHGHTTSAVFGRIWRYCQLSDGVCNAALETIATDLHMTRKSIAAHVRILVKNGYLEDRTPGLAGHPHTYADTGKAQMQVTVQAGPAQSGRVKTTQPEPPPAGKNLPSQNPGRVKITQPAGKNLPIKESIKDINTPPQQTSPLENAQFVQNAQFAPPDVFTSERILLSVTGFPAVPFSEQSKLDATLAMLQKYGQEKTLSALQTAYSAWCGSKKANGQKYSRLNWGWVDWAMVHLATGEKPWENNHAKSHRKNNHAGRRHEPAEKPTPSPELIAQINKKRAVQHANQTV